MARPQRVTVWQRFVRSKAALVVGGVVLLFIGVSFARETVRRAQVQQEIRKLEGEVQRLEDQRTSLTKLIDYFQSPLFQEQEARQKLGLAKPGESVFIVPLSEGPAEVPGAANENDERAAEGASNPVRWWRYFFAPPSPKQESSTNKEPS